LRLTGTANARVCVFVIASILLWLLACSVSSARLISGISNIILTDSPTGGIPDVDVYAQAGIGPVGIIGDPGTLLQITIDNAQLGTSRPLHFQGKTIDVNAAPLSLTKVVLTIRSAVPISARAEIRSSGVHIHLFAAARVVPDNTTRMPPTSGRELGSAGKLTVMKMKYADVSEVAGILVAGSNIASNDVFTPASSPLSQGAGGLSSVGTPSTITYDVSSSNSQNAGPLGERISDTIAIDRRLNALIIIADAATTESIRLAVEQLDVPLRSVLLETEIVELSDSAARNVGFDYTSASGALATATFTPNSLQQPNATASLQAQVFAQVSRGQGKILAKPSILALDGRTASILTGDQIPIITTLSFPSSGSSVVQQQIQYLTVGVNVQIRPQISSDGIITTHVYANVSSVTGFIQSYPQISQRFASTVASVHDGQSLVIGGLLQDTEIQTFSKVPLLGDLPIIGQFFKLANTSKTHTNLYIMVTPHLIDQPK
jgi:general secretion pathway protein D